MHGIVLWKKLRSCSSLSTQPSPPQSSSPPAAVEAPFLPPKSSLSPSRDNWITDYSSHGEWIREFTRRMKFETNLITWEDKRCNDKFISSLPPSKIAIHSGYGCATLFWLSKYRTDIIKKSQYAGSIMDLLVAYICDLDEPLMSDQIASSWGYFDNTQLSWQTELLSQSGFPVTLLPRVYSAGSNAGFLSEDWHSISKGTIVKVAVGDCQCSFLSSCNDETTAVINIGTSAQLAVQLPKTFDFVSMKSIPTAVQLYPHFGNSQLAVAASLNGGNVINAFVLMLMSWQEELGLSHVDAELLHSRIKDLANKTELRSDLAIVPTIHGERHRLCKCAHVFNIRSDNTSLTNVVHKIYTGLIENLFEIMPVSVLQSLGIKQIACTGNIFNDNRLLKVVVERISGLQCIVKSGADAAFGAAMSSCILPKYNQA